MATKAQFAVIPAKGGYSLSVNGLHVDTRRTLSELYRKAGEIWISFAKALGVYGKHTKATFLATHPVPYVNGSLKPAVKLVKAKRPLVKLTPKARKAVRVIKRHAAVEKIIEGARIGMKVDVPKTGKMVTPAKGKKFARRADDARAKIQALA